MRASQLIPLVVSTALFMENMDSTVISTSLPQIAADLNEDVFALKLAMTSYLISLAIFIPISGWMADRFGAKNVFRSAIIIYLIGSLSSTFALNIEMLVLTRFIQGIGGAMMVPVGRLFLLRSIPKSELVQALAWLTIPALVGPVLGPVIGGFITTHFGWRWIFTLNLPIGLLGITLVTLFFHDIREKDVPPFDWKGFALSSVSLTIFMMGLATGGQHLVPMYISTAFILIGISGCILYCFYALNTENPVIDLRLLKIPTFAISILAGTIFRIGIGATPFILPLMLQLGFGFTPLESGSITFISAAGALFMKAFATQILKRFGFRNVLTTNAVIAAIFVGIICLFTEQTPAVIMLSTLFIGGIFRSLEFTSINALSYADISNKQMSSATSFASVMQQLSASIGISLGAFILEFTNSQGLHKESDFTTAFVTIALLSASSALFFYMLPKNAGNTVSGYKGG